jgi:dTMP kinase
MKKNKLKKGVFIVFEGGEKAGKSTVIKFLQNELAKCGLDVLVTHEPGGTPLGKIIREKLLKKEDGVFINPIAESFLFFADRAQHVADVVLPALKDGKIVLEDRFSFSTFAYQHYGKGVDLNFLLQADAVSRQNLDPDIIIFLDVDPRIALKRGIDPNNPFETAKIKFHDKLRHGYLETAHNDPEKWKIVDASKSANEVAKEVLKIVLNVVSRK